MLMTPEWNQVCSTLSFSGAGVFKRMNRGFDVVVIDEAAQAVSKSLPLTSCDVKFLPLSFLKAIYCRPLPVSEVVVL